MLLGMQLDTLLESIAQGTCKLDHEKADLLLRSSADPRAIATVQRRKFKNRVHPSGCCTFFVTPDGVDAGGKKRPHDSEPDPNEWATIKVSNSFSLTGSKNAPPFTNRDHPYEGVVRQSASIEKPTPKGSHSVAVFALVALPNHPAWDQLVPRQGTDDWRYLDPDKDRLCVVNSSLVASTVQAGALAVDGSGGGSVQGGGDRVFGKVEVDELLIQGENVREELMKLTADMFSLSVGGGGGSGPPPESRRADLGEWMKVCPGTTRPQPGDLVECLGHDDLPMVSLEITMATGSTLFVVSSEPAWAGNMPVDLAERTKGVVVAFLGRVPVHVVGEAPANSFLVPSGRNDGCARAVSPQQLTEEPSLRDKFFGVVWALLPPDTSGRAVVLAYIWVRPCYKGVDELALLGSSADTISCTECSVPKKFDVKGHSKTGWCPTKQCYAPGAAAKQLKNWEQLTGGHPDAEPDELASAFVAAVQCGDFVEVKALLAGEGVSAGAGTRRVKALGEHLALLRVPKRLWSWSVLQEAASKLAPSDDEHAKAFKTFSALVDHCIALQIDLYATLPKKTDSFATVAHQVAYRGSKIAMEKLIEAGGNPLFSRTQSGWLPLHTALSTRAPAYTAGNAGNSDAPGYKADLSFAPWLLGMMQACGDVSGLTTLPKGFVAKHGVDVEAFQRLLEK